MALNAFNLGVQGGGKREGARPGRPEPAEVGDQVPRAAATAAPRSHRGEEARPGEDAASVRVAAQDRAGAARVHRAAHSAVVN